MSWKFFLSAHPFPILTDENALLLLAMIERVGLIAEPDLEVFSGVKSPGLQQHLYRLQMGKFIEHGASFVRLTEVGRNAIDRLSLFEDILKDILDSLNARGPQRQIYTKQLRAY